MSVAFVESLLSAKIKSLLLSGIPAEVEGGAVDPVTFPVLTFWESLQDGQVKVDSRRKIAIGINPRGYNDQLGWSATLTGWISIEDDSADTSTLTAEYERVMNVLEQCQHAAAGASVSLLNVTGFDVDDFQILEGGECGLDPQLDVFYAVINFELDGTLTAR